MFDLKVLLGGHVEAGSQLLGRSDSSYMGDRTVVVISIYISSFNTAHAALPHSLAVQTAGMAALASVAPHRLARGACGQIEAPHARFAGGCLGQWAGAANIA
eukprot:6182415-Pleurochrysis_carterae.AAC.2